LADDSQRFLDLTNGGQLPTADIAPEAYVMEENEERSMIEAPSRNDPKLKALQQVRI